MPMTNSDLENSYSPSSILEIGSKLIGVQITLRGIVWKNEGLVSDSEGYFADNLEDETTLNQIIVKSKSNIHNIFKSGESYYFKGEFEFADVDKKESVLIFKVADYAERHVSKMFSALKNKKNVKCQPDMVLKNLIKAEKTLEIALISDNNSLVTQKVNPVLQNFSRCFSWTTFPVNFNSKPEFLKILDPLKKHDKKFDAVAIIRSQIAQNNSVFDDADVLGNLLEINSISFSVVQQAGPKTLLDKYSDLSFETEDELAKFLFTIANDAAKEIKIQKDLESVLIELKQVKHEFELTNQKLQNSENEIASTKKELEVAQKELVTKDSIIFEFKTNLESLKLELEKNNKIIADTQSKLNAVAMQHAVSLQEKLKGQKDFETAIKKLNEEKSLLQNEYEALNKNLVENKAIAMQNEITAKNKIDELEDSLSQLNADWTQLRDENKQASETISQNNQQISVLVSNIKKLESQKSNLESNIKNLEAQKTEMTKVVFELKKLCEQDKNIINQLSQKLKDVDVLQNDYVQRLKNSEKIISEQIDLNASIKQESSVKDEIIENKDSEIICLKSELQIKSDRIKNITKDLNKQVTEMIDIENKNKALSGDNERKAKLIEQLNHNLKENIEEQSQDFLAYKKKTSKMKLFLGISVLIVGLILGLLIKTFLK